MPKTAKITQFKIPNKIPWVAAEFAALKSCSPNLRDTNEFKPMPVPTPNAINNICIGNAIDTAVSSASPVLICDTNTLSTTLYKACTNIENIAGNDIDMINLSIGACPILFSCDCF